MECNKCRKELVTNTTTMSRHLDSVHRIFPPAEKSQPNIDSQPGYSKSAADQACLEYVLRDALPFRTVESKEFIAFCRILRPDYHPLSRHCIADKVRGEYIRLHDAVRIRLCLCAVDLFDLAGRVEQNLLDVRQWLSPDNSIIISTPHISLTSDIATINKVSFVTTTCSFINDAWQLLTRLLDVSPLQGELLFALLASML